MELITKLVSRAITGPWPHMLAQWPTCPLGISRSSHCQPLLTQGLMSQSLDFQVGKLGWQRVCPAVSPLLPSRQVCRGHYHHYPCPKRTHALASFLRGGIPEGPGPSSSSSSGCSMAQWLKAWDLG